MANKQMLILKWHKKTENTPWVITMEEESGLVFEIGVGPGAKTPIGPYLEETFMFMEKQISSYPFNYDMQHISDAKGREIRVRMISEYPVFLDISTYTSKTMLKYMKYSNYKEIQEEVTIRDGSQIMRPSAGTSQMRTMSIANQSTSNEWVDRIELSSEHVNDENKYWIVMDKTSLRVTGGGQIKGYIVGFIWPEDEEVPEMIGNQDMKSAQKEITIDYLGVKSFSTFSKENSEKARWYNTTAKVLSTVGEEAKAYNTNLVDENTMFAVSLQYDKLINQPIYSEDKNLLGVVYKTPYTNYSDVLMAVQTGHFTGVNINKSLLRESFSQNSYLQKVSPETPHLPLVEFTGYEDQTNMGIRLSGWARQLSLQIPRTEGSVREESESPGTEDAVQSEVERIQEAVIKDIDKGNKRKDEMPKGYINNDLSFVEPYDDRLESGELYNTVPEYEVDEDGEINIEEDIPYDYRNKVRIGDVIMEVPPMSIRMDKQFQNEAVQGMRSKTTLQKQVGHTRNVLTLELYFHDLENINGRKVKAFRRDNGEVVYYYIDGLRSLLAQFKKTPFLPIDNEYINESLGINNVALRGISSQTIEGFPEALNVTLTLEEMDTTAYLMGEEHLGSLINYPLMRWHYQSILTEPNTYQPWKTYLPTIDHLDNRFSFSVVSRAELDGRVEALQRFRRMKIPRAYKAELLDKDKNDQAENYQDGLEAKSAYDQYTRFLEVYKTGYTSEVENIYIPEDLKSKYKEPSKVPVVVGEAIGFDQLDYYMSKNSFSQEDTEIGQSMGKYLYGADDSDRRISRKVPLFNASALRHGVDFIESAFFPWNSITSGSSVRENTTQGIIRYMDDEKVPGVFQLIVRDQDKISQFDKEFKDLILEDNPSLTGAPSKFIFKTQLSGNFLRKTSRLFGGGSLLDTDKNGVVYLFPAIETKEAPLLSFLRKMVSTGDEADDKVEEYSFEYNELAARINQTEDNLPMEHYNVPDLIPMNLQVSLENNFSMVQPRSAETPAMQYFGAQEPKVFLTFETSQKGVEALEKLFRTVADYAKNYRDGIVSGFMGISNPLLNLFGIQSVLPDTIQYDTVPNQPGRFLVSLTFLGFDKSQRRQEALYGYVGGVENKELIDLAYDNYDPKVDSLYINEKMRQMELYPDMEMGKVSELNTDLKGLNIGLSEWENRSDQVYLDPDFYVSTSHTYRNFLNDLIESPEEIVTRFTDGEGLTALSDLSAGNPLIMTNEDEEEFERQAEEAVYNDPETNWEGFYDINSDGAEASNSKQNEEDSDEINSSPQSPELTGNMTKQDLKNLETIATTIPTYEKYLEWGIGNNRDAYERFLKNPKGTMTERNIWYMFADTVMDEFSGLAFVNGEEKMLRNRKNHGIYPVSYYADTTESWPERSLYTRSWSNPTNFYVYQKEKRTEWWTNKLKNGIDEQLMKEHTRGRLDNDLAFATKMPFMRVFTQIKAIASSQSKWNQFDENGKPFVVETNGTLPGRVGIMGYNLAKAKDDDERWRLLWDWKYNIRKSIHDMAKVYKQAEKSKFFEISIRKLDWAIASHSGNPLPKIISSNDKKDDVPFGDKNAPIAPENDSLYLEVIKDWTTETGRITDRFAQIIYSNGQRKSINDIFKLYNAEHGQVIQYVHNSPLVNGQLDDTEKALEYLETQELESIAEKMFHNVEDWTVEKKVQSMFTDLIQHDHTGRLLRAFPSFSLQLIDEGKWYGNFRTWDNFYGYNALNSIDVYKSRKIAADTLTVEMSNMYGGLSGMRTDMRHPDLQMPSFFSSHFWEHYVFGKPTEEVLEERRNIYESILLQAGARVHLRMGYGSDARHLPILFNGTISEIDSDDVVTFVAQGDGLELTNAISGSPDDENKKFFQIIEPSEYIGRLLTSKGNALQNFISNKSEGLFFRESPLGIAHFGSSIQSESGNYNPFSNEFGESTQNVYSQNGQMTKEQWMDSEGRKLSVIQTRIEPLIDGVLGTGSFMGDNDEDNIGVKVYGSTPWEIIQTFALASADYIGAVFPFEMRSSLFFGKPHWPVAYRYDSEFIFDKATEKMRRQITYTHQKTFMQAHIYSTQFNILSNEIVASDEGVYNNVIVSYDGRGVGPMQADSDIRLDRQKTAHVEANIISRSLGAGYFGTNYWTAEAQAQKYGHSTVRDFMKDMYKGSYTVMGDPTVKPYDICYMSDDIVDMEGVHLVKAVHHSMNGMDGFITTIEPDAYVVNWDAEMLFIPDKIHQVSKDVVIRAVGTSISLAGGMMGSAVLNKLSTKIFESGTALFAKVPAEIVDGVTRWTISRSYELLGRALGSSEMIDTAVHLRSVKTKSTAERFINNLGRQRENIFKTVNKTAGKEAKVAKETLEAATKNLSKLKAKEVSGAFDVAEEILQASKDLEAAEKLYKVAKGKKVTNDVVKTVSGLDKVTTGVKKVASGAKSVLKSKMFWSFAITVGIEILTSGLVEAWTRKKQNAECVKVIPLQYKGQSWTAGMNGHRGSVKGDDPSLADKLMNNRFGDSDKGTDNIWWSFVPKIINFIEDGSRIESHTPIEFSED